MTKYIQKKGKSYIPTKAAKEIAQAPQDVYSQAKKREKFWENLAKEGIAWVKPWKTNYKKERSGFSWFKEGQLNLCYNAVDRHINSNNTAIIFVPENPKEKKQVISYQKLYQMVNQAALILKKKGINKHDVVAIYMPLIPEALAFMLACTRIGAIHSIVFSAFSAEALRTRIKDGRAKLLISADHYYRKGKKIKLSPKANKACKGIKIKKIILKRSKSGRILNAKKNSIRTSSSDERGRHPIHTLHIWNHREA